MDSGIAKSQNLLDKGSIIIWDQEQVVRMCQPIGQSLQVA